VTQIRGRAHRQLQKKEVVCYHLLAEGTADLLISGMAHDKHAMLEAFLSKRAGRGMYRILSISSVWLS
jgi:SNF2 family DNA or RNA helicase